MTGKTETKKVIFSSFEEFWHFTKRLDSHQRNKIFSSLPAKEQKRLTDLYKEGGWSDYFMHHRIENVLDGIKKDFDIDLLWIKTKAVVLHKCTYLKKSEWQWISDILGRYPSNLTYYVLGGIDVVQEKGDMVCIIPKRK